MGSTSGNDDFLDLFPVKHSRDAGRTRGPDRACGLDLRTCLLLSARGPKLVTHLLAKDSDRCRDVLVRSSTIADKTRVRYRSIPTIFSGPGSHRATVIDLVRNSKGADRTLVRYNSIPTISSGLRPGFRRPPDRGSRRRSTPLAIR